MLVWRCKGEKREKIPVAWFGVLKPLFSVQDEQLIKTAIKYQCETNQKYNIKLTKHRAFYFEQKDGSEYKRKEKSVLNKIKD